MPIFRITHKFPDIVKEKPKQSVNMQVKNACALPKMGTSGRALKQIITLSFVLIPFCLAACVTKTKGGELEGPFVSNITSNSSVIWWRSPSPLGGEVVIAGRLVPDDKPPFEVMLSNLEPNKPHKYYVKFRNGMRRPVEGTYTFFTAPEPGGQDTFRFAFLCDSRGSKPSDPVNASVLEMLLNHAKSQSARFVCFAGDLIFGYSNKEDAYRGGLRLWKSVAANVMNEMPIYVTMGNHDIMIHRHSDRQGAYDLDGVKKDGWILTSEEVFAEEFVNPTNGPDQPEQPAAPPYNETSYSFDYGNARFVFINTNYWAAQRTYPHKPGDPHRLYDLGNPEGRIMDGQLKWLGDDLQRARSAGIQHIFVFGHEPAFPVGIHAGDAMHYDGHATPSLKRDIRARRHRFWKMLSEFGVLVAFFGDEHNYSRGLIGPAGEVAYDPPVWQIISGGAGAKLSGARLMHLPWANSIHAFAKRHHYCLVTVHGQRVTLDVFALPEGFDRAPRNASFQLIDSVQDLTMRN